LLRKPIGIRLRLNEGLLDSFWKTFFGKIGAILICRRHLSDAVTLCRVADRCFRVMFGFSGLPRADRGHHGGMIKSSYPLILSSLILFSSAAYSGAREYAPNVVLIFTDDQGYGDLSCFGSAQVQTPRIDRMATEGMRLTSFYVPAPVCTPSRAGLMTGSYPKRVSLATGSDFGVLLDGDPKGLNPSEITIAEILKKQGYATGIFGKWHLGDQLEFLPTRQGFDEYY
jgi:hypothetical protein